MDSKSSIFSFVFSLISATVLLPKFSECAKGSVVIVGAGTAGVSAATRLLKNGFEDITILEAQDRIGGRLHSVFFGEAYVDLGPRHVMGTNGNVVYEAAKKLGILQYNPIASYIYHSRNGKIDEELRDEIFEVFNWTVPAWDEKHYNVSAGSYILNRFYKTKTQLFEGKENLIESIVRLIEQEFLRFSGPLSWFHRPMVTDYKQIPGGNYVWSGYGYITYLTILIENLPTKKQKIFHKNLLLNKTVTKIYWGENEAITTKCSDGSEYTSNYVIFTPSLGVLKKHNKDIFRPNLPLEKQKSIEALYYGGELKVVMKFPKRWWPKDDFYGFYLAWDEEDVRKIPLEFPQAILQDGQNWVKDVMLFTSEKNNTNVLICWISGHSVFHVEHLSDVTIFEGCTYALFKFFEHRFDVVRPDDYVMEKQWMNPYYLGPYSFQSFEAPRGEHSANVILQEPLQCGLNCAVLFAGEATNPIHFQTVHGASESGFKAADTIKNFEKPPQ